MAVERAVVQDHMVAPAHAVEDGARSGDGADRKACAECFAECAEVGLQAVILLASARSIAESGDHFVEDEESAVLVGEV